MKLFKNIFAAKKAESEFVNRRRTERFPVGKDFPIQVVDPDSKESLLVSTISQLGVGVFSTVDLREKNLSKLQFKLEQFILSVPIEIRNSYNSDQGKLFGMELKFESLEQKSCFSQLILPIVIGNSMREMNKELVNQNEKEYQKRIFRSIDGVYLTLRYKVGATDKLPLSFEFEFDDYDLRGSSKDMAIEIFNVDKGRKKDGRKVASLLRVSSESDERQDLTKLFFWSVMNLNPNVGKEIKSYLMTFK